MLYNHINHLENLIKVYISIYWKKNKKSLHCVLVRCVITNLARKCPMYVVNKFLCKVCANEFRYKESLKTHEKLVHKKFSCKTSDY